MGYDEEQDLAVLKAVDAEDLPTAEFGDSDQCRVGDTVYAIGNPLGVELRGTLTEGIISAINRNVQMEGRDHDPHPDHRRPEQRQLRRPSHQ